MAADATANWQLQLLKWVCSTCCTNSSSRCIGSVVGKQGKQGQEEKKRGGGGGNKRCWGGGCGWTASVSKAGRRRTMAADATDSWQLQLLK
jgi:hypothetical protein